MSLDTVWYNNTVLTWLTAVGTAGVVLVGLLIVRRVIAGKVAALARRTTTRWDDLAADLLGRTRAAFLVVVALVAGATVLSVSDRVSWLIGRALVLAFLVQAGLWGGAAAMAVVNYYTNEKMGGDRGAAGMFSAFGFVLQLVIWSALLLLGLENVGVNVSTLIAGFGVGGVALALASQHILGDVFSSFVIVLDKPFVIGDFIIVGDLMGSVEHVGLKTTRLRALSGEQLIFANSDLLDSRIHNYGRMAERRVLFRLGVTYDTPRTALRQIPGMIRSAIEAQTPVRFDRSHFASYGESSLDFESVYYVLSPDYNKYMDVQQAINFRIHEQFEAACIDFAFPTRTVIVQPVDADRPDVGAAEAPQPPR